MKENKKKTQKKKTRTIVLAVAAFMVVAFGISLVSSQLPKQTKDTPKAYILDSGTGKTKDTLTESSTALTSSSQSLPDSSNQLAHQFVSDYVSQTLDKSSLDTRAAALKSEMTASIFASSDIQSDTQTLESLLAAYDKKEAVDTNSSVRLVSRSMTKLTLYQDIAHSESYYAAVFYTEVAPDNSDQFSFEKTLTFSIQNNQIASLEELSTVSVTGGN